MPSAKGREDLLNSWKEIAAYLGVDERTCQRWEKRYGLPVRRLEEAAKSRVHADRAELERWRATAFRNATLAADSDPPNRQAEAGDDANLAAPPRRRSGGLLILPALVGAGALAVFFLLTGRLDRQPVDFRIDPPFLVILNRHGRELWRHDTQRPDLVDEAFIRARFQTDRQALSQRGISTHTHPVLLIKDLDGDGRNETLFVPSSRAEASIGLLWLFDHRGALIWKFDANAAVTAGGRPFPPNCVLQSVHAGDLNGDGKTEMLIISHLWMESPSRVVVLDLKGSILGEYWHFGQISDYAVRDIDGDGVSEILCSGQVNEDTERPCFFILDPRNLKGAGPILGPKSKFEGKGPGSELVSVILPLTPLEARYQPGVAAVAVDALDSGYIRVTVDVDGPYYEFDRRGRLTAITLGHDFKRSCDRAVADGILPAPIDIERTQRELRAGIRYYDGKTRSWVKDYARADAR